MPQQHELDRSIPTVAGGGSAREAAATAPTPSRRAPVLAGAAVVLALAAVALAALSFQGTPHLAVGRNVLVSGKGAEALIDENNSPTVVADPRVPNHLVAVNRIDRPRYSALLHWSDDGGATWTDTALPLPPGRDRPYAPDAVFAPDGTLYVTYVNLEGTGNDPQTLWISRSSDGGRTLGPPVAVANHLTFQARVTAGSGGFVDVTWLQATSVGTLTINGPATIVSSRSTDGGRTFAAPVPVSDSNRTRVGAATPVIDSRGNVDVLYEDFKSDVRDFLNLDGPAWRAPSALVLSRSTDGGKSFGRGVEVDAGVVATERFLVYLPRFPSIAAGPGDTLAVAWADGREGADRVYTRTSRDGGATWTSLVAVGGPGGAGVSAWLPAVSLAPNGRMDVLFLAGHRNSGDGLVGTYLATSADDVSFTTVRASSVLFDSRIGPLTGPIYLPPDLGARLGLASSASGAVAAWVDTRLGNADNGRQDIVAARVAISPPGPSAARLGVIAALLLVAAAALVVAWRSRTGGGAPAGGR